MGENFTPYSDVNDILTIIYEDLNNIFNDNKLIGVYLTGSLTYGDFDRGSSDIDLLVVVLYVLSQQQLRDVANMHDRIAKKYPKWANRIECSYITKEMLNDVEPPKTPRPYINGGRMWEEAPYGKEWLLNLYMLYDCGIALVGLDPKELIGFPINFEEVRKASKDDLYLEWEPMLKCPSALKDSHFQAYAIFTLCRILHRAKNNKVVSKRFASSWVKDTYGAPWIELIETAERWQHGYEMDASEEILKFIKFVIREVK